jgi:hypothetical protein
MNVEIFEIDAKQYFFDENLIKTNANTPL